MPTEHTWNRSRTLRVEFGESVRGFIDREFITVAIAVLAVAGACFALPHRAGTPAVLWPLDALILAIVLRVRRDRLRRSFALVVGAIVVTHLVSGHDAPVGLRFAFVHIVITFFAALVLRRYPRPANLFETAGNFVRFVVVGAILAPAASTSFDILAMHGTTTLWLSRSIAGGLGSTVLVAFCAMLDEVRFREIRVSPHVVQSACALGATIAVTCFACTTGSLQAIVVIPGLLALVAYTSGPYGSSAALVLVSCIALLFTSLGIGGVVRPREYSTAQYALLVEECIAFVAFATLSLAVLLRDRERRHAESVARFGADSSYARQMRALTIVASNDTLDPRDGIDSALDICREVLREDWAYYGRFDLARASTTIVTSVGDVAEIGIDVGDEIPFERSILGRHVRSRDVVISEAVEDLGIPRNGLMNYAALTSYIFAIIWVGDAPYGAIGFVGRRRRTGAPYGDQERDFVKLTASLISGALERCLQHERLEELAYRDALTQLPNRAAFDARLAVLLDGTSPFAVLFVDVDRFKAINDSYGHGVGDDVLRAIARLLEACGTDESFVARIGGDEFAVIVAAKDIEEKLDGIVHNFAHSLQRTLPVGSDRIAVSASVGSSLFPSDGYDSKSLLRHADRELYRMKNAERTVDERAFGRAS